MQNINPDFSFNQAQFRSCNANAPIIVKSQALGEGGRPRIF